MQLYIVEDPEPNAFVAGGQNIFVNTGLLTELGSMDQVRAVIAHELGHITGGHQVRRDQALAGAGGIAAIGMLGAAAAAVGGAPGAGVAIATGASQAAHRSLLAHSRTEEASADQAGLRYLAAAGSDPEAMLEVLDHFRGQDEMLGAYADAYAQNHPLWSDRIAMIEDRVAQLPPGGPPSAEDAYWYGRMVAKLDAFLKSPAQTFRKYPASDTSETALLSRAIAWHRRPDPAKAAATVDALIALRPDDPYYHELKGQFLLESGHAAAAAEAYRQAVALAPKEPLILGGLGRALLNMDDDSVDRRGPRRARPLGRRRQGQRRRAARPGARRGAARQRGRRGARHRRALHARRPLPRRRPQRRARRGAAARRLPGLAAGAGHDNHGATRAELKDPMRQLLLGLTAALALATALPAAAQEATQSSPFSDGDKAALHAEIRAYLLANPEILMEMIQLLEAQEAGRDRRRATRALVAANAAAIFDDGFSWVGGNPDGKFTLVEFLDYQCGYCRARSPDLSELVTSDGDIRLIVKEMPILGPGSELAARAAIATLITDGPESLRRRCTTG